MKDVYYTDSFDGGDSEVIEAVYYSRPTHEMYVVLHNGHTAGYRNVSEFTFRKFAQASSFGHFWNVEVKNHYTGVSGDVNLIPATTPEPVSPAVESEFAVVFEVNGTLTISGAATDANDALRKATEIVNAQVSGTIKVKELIQKFV